MMLFSLPHNGNDLRLRTCFVAILSGLAIENTLRKLIGAKEYLTAFNTELFMMNRFRLYYLSRNVRTRTVGMGKKLK
jgi:hypothetical protein